MRTLVLITAALALTACPAPDASSGSTTPDAKPAAKTDASGAGSQPTKAMDHGDHDKAADAAAFTPLEGAKVMFTEPADGATVSSPVKVVMGVEGAEVKPAGELAKGTGHHHIIVNGKAIEAGTVVPKDDTHIHFGDGSTETELELPAGEHTLTLQFADGMHRSYGKPLSATITVTVGE